MSGAEHVGGLRWYLIHCRPRQDERVLENLQRQDFQCYRPMRSVERCRDGRIYGAAEALFPGYLFVQLDRLTDNWYAIRSTRGVHQIGRPGLIQTSFAGSKRSSRK